MKVILISPTGELDCDIVISEFPYEFGRNNKHIDIANFCSGKFKESFMHMSGRHALFELVLGGVYLRDLESTNGTYVNGEKLTSTAVEIFPGDRIKFSGRIEFVVDIEYPPQQLPSGKMFSLVPEGNSQLDVFKVDALPMLVGRLSSVFRKYDDLVKSSAGFLASRHARIFIKENNIYIADLGSRHGTRVSGMKIYASRAKLQSSCLLKFTDLFQYRLEFEADKQPKPEVDSVPQSFSYATGAQQDASRESLNERTVFFNESTCFMSVVSEDDLQLLKNEQKYPSSNGTSQPGVMSKGKLGGLLPAAPVAAILAFVVLLAVYFIFMFQSDEQDIQSLLDSRQYLAALENSASRLEGESDDSPYIKYALRAFHEGLLVDFIIAYNAKDNAIRPMLDRYSGSTENFTEGENIVSLLAYIVELNDFIRIETDKDVDAATFDYEQIKQALPSLVKKWKENKYLFEMKLNQLETVNRDFAAIKKDFYKKLNVLLRLDKKEYAEIAKLEKQIRQLVNSRMYSKMIPLVEIFDKTYPDITGDEELLSDAVNFREITDYANNGDFLESVGYLKSHPMKSQLFKGLISEWKSQNMPADKDLDILNKAGSLWKSGNFDEAVHLIEALQSEGVFKGSLAGNLKHYKKVLAMHQAMTRNSPVGCDDIADFYNTLKAGDVFFSQLYSANYSSCRKVVTSEIEKQVSITRELFAGYTETGGISGIMRMEGQVSEKFRVRAEKLAEAAGVSNKIRDLASIYSLDLTASQLDVLSLVDKEFNKQQSRLKEIKSLLPESVYADKMSRLSVD